MPHFWLEYPSNKGDRKWGCAYCGYTIRDVEMPDVDELVLMEMFHGASGLHETLYTCDELMVYNLMQE